MGYHTDFAGSFELDQPLTAAQVAYLQAFNRTRRMQRDTVVAATFPDPVRKAVGLPIGVAGGYYVGNTKNCGQEEDASIKNYNDPPPGQPGLWCQWVPTDDGHSIVWDEGEKFYDYVEWLQYIVDHFLKSWGRSITGEMRWEGEETGDLGTIYVKENKIEAVADNISNSGPSWDRKTR